MIDSRRKEEERLEKLGLVKEKGQSIFQKIPTICQQLDAKGNIAIE